MSTFTNEDRVILESLDFEPACEKSNHDSDESARWAAVYLPLTSCGCPTPGVLLWCEPCRARWARARRKLCNHCGAVQSTDMSPIVRFEPLR